MNQLISIIIPVFNVAEYLDRCLNTVTSQTYKNLEIILIDDGSADDSGKICDIWGEKDNRIKVFHTVNKGVAAARNYAISIAKGDYIGFVDPDDYVNVDMFEILLNAADRFAADIVICGFEEVKSEVHRTKQVPYTRYYARDEALHELIKDEDIQSYVWNKLFKQQCVPKNPFPEIKRISDLAGMHKFFQRADVIVHINRSCYHYCLRDVSLVSKPGSIEPSVFHCLAMQFRYNDLYIENEKIRVFAAEKYIKWIETNIKKKILETLHGCDDTSAELIKSRIAPFYSAHVKDFRNFVKGFTPEKEKELFLFLNDPVAYSNPDEYASLYKDCAPAISVIMPVYNAGRFLYFALDSLKQQTFLNFEVICVNDGSTDCSLEILKEYEKEDYRIRVINNTKNLCAGVSRNMAMKLARGKYITFLDADDALTKDALEQFYIKGLETDADCIICQSFDSKGIHEFSLHSQYLPTAECFSASDIPDFIFNFTTGAPGGKCVKRSLIAENKIEYSKLARSEDIIFVYKTLIKSKKIAVIKKPLYQKDVILNEKSLEHTKHETPLIFWEAITEIKSMLKEEGALEKFRRSIINAHVNRCLYNINRLKHSSGYNILKVKKLFSETGIDRKIIKELELYDHEKDYFFVPAYSELLDFLEKTYEEYLQDYADYATEQEERLRSAQHQLKELHASFNTLKKYITGRIDIKNYGGNNNAVLVIANSDDSAQIQNPDWFKNEQGTGMVLQSTKGVMETVIQCIGNGELKIWLRGMDCRNKDNIRVPVWINYKSLFINGVCVFKEPKLVCHDNPFIYKLNVADGQIIKIFTEWQYAQDEQTQAEIKQLTEAKTGTENKLKQAQAEIKQLTEAKTGTENKLKQAQAEIKQLTEAKTGTENKLKQAQMEIKQLTETKTETENKLKQAQVEIKQLTEAKTGTENKLKQAREEIKQLTEAKTGTEDKLKQAQEENKQLTEVKKEMENKLHDARKRVAQLAKDKLNTSEKLSKEQRKVAQLNNELKNVKNGWSFKIGRVITWAPRKIRGLLK